MKKIVLMISIILILGTISPVMASIQPDLYEPSVLSKLQSRGKCYL